jgi:hypothetical protein
MRRAAGPLLVVLALASGPLDAQQVADSAFDTSVPRPAYRGDGPRVVIDEAHQNFHTLDGRYAPFAQLLASDGFRVAAGTSALTRSSLAGIDVLVIANALGPGATNETSDPAFTPAECDAVHTWVREGGALLLVADHAPFGDAAKLLASRFGVTLGGGFVFDTAHAFDGNATMLVFSEANGLLGMHAILRGREAAERVRRVVSFTGESLSVPDGAVALLRLGPAAREAPTGNATNAGTGVPVPGRAQAIAMPVGRGRLVVLGEAAMLSAQVLRYMDAGKPAEFRMGMNVPGSDDRQFALNLMRWLSGALP